VSPVTIRVRPPATRLTVVPEQDALLYYESLRREAARMKRRHGPRWWQRPGAMRGAM
jgi:hypothetical protein